MTVVDLPTSAGANFVVYFDENEVNDKACRLLGERLGSPAGDIVSVWRNRKGPSPAL